MDSELKEWLGSRPKIIRDLFNNYPPGEYIISDEAPYGISCSGTKVELESYFENGEVGIVIQSKNKLPEALQREKDLGIIHGRTYKEIREINQSDIKVVIEPKWLLSLDQFKNRKVYW